MNNLLTALLRGLSLCRFLLEVPDPLTCFAWSEPLMPARGISNFFEKVRYLFTRSLQVGSNRMNSGDVRD